MSSLVSATSLPSGAGHADGPLAVVVFCAEWCGTCRAFRPLVDRLGAAHPDVVFAWVDIEDDAELAGDIEVENFPTLALFRDGEPLYFGDSLPLENVVAQLLRAAAAARQPLSPIPEEVFRLAQRLFGRD